MDYEEWKKFRTKLKNSKFRSSFSLTHKDKEMYKRKGKEVMYLHALELIRQRLAPANPKNDTHQTPYHGHPVFVAQHATATCCRKCLMRWHKIPRGRELSEKEVIRVIDIILFWIEENY